MDRPKRPRLRRILKWAGLITCVLIVVAWGVSLRWSIVWTGSYRMAALYDGSVLAYRRGGEPWEKKVGWDVSAASPSECRYGFCWPSIQLQPLPLYSGFLSPCWLPLFVIAIPTAFLWHRDRRCYPPGHCQQCGYDLTGNESGRCPECGEQVERRAGSRPVNTHGQ